MTTKEILKNALKLIDKPEKWVKFKLYNEDKTAFCALGALDRTPGYYDSKGRVAREILLKKLPKGYRKSIVTFNNDAKTTHKDIVNWFRRAIRAAK